MNATISFEGVSYSLRVVAGVDSEGFSYTEVFATQALHA